MEIKKYVFIKGMNYCFQYIRRQVGGECLFIQFLNQGVKQMHLQLNKGFILGSISGLYWVPNICFRKLFHEVYFKPEGIYSGRDGVRTLSLESKYENVKD